MPTSSPGAPPRIRTVPGASRRDASCGTPRRRDGHPLTLYLPSRLLVPIAWTPLAGDSALRESPLRGNPTAWAGFAPHLGANGSLALLHARRGDPLGSAGVALSPREEAVPFAGSLSPLVLLHSRVRESARRRMVPVRFHGSFPPARLSPLRS